MILPSWAFYLAILVQLVGLAGVVLPVVPGVALMWVTILVYAIAERFATIDPLSFAVLTLLGAAGATSDLWLGQLGAQVAGASGWSTLWGTLGALLGGLIGFLFAGVGAVPGSLFEQLLQLTAPQEGLPRAQFRQLADEDHGVGPFRRESVGPGHRYRLFAKQPFELLEQGVRGVVPVGLDNHDLP